MLFNYFLNPYFLIFAIFILLGQLQMQHSGIAFNNAIHTSHPYQLCFQCLAHSPHLQCSNCSKHFHLQCINKKMAILRNALQFNCYYCQYAEIRLCPICKQHIAQPKNFSSSIQQTENIMPQRKACQQVEQGQKQSKAFQFFICTVCNCQFHKKCLKISIQLIKAYQAIKIKGFIGFVCEFCLLRRNYTGIVQHVHDNEKNQQLYYVRINSNSPLDYALFDKPLIESLSSSKLQTSEFLIDRIEVIIKVKTPKEHLQKQQNDLLNILKSRLKSRKVLKFYRPNNFKFLIKWKNQGFDQMSWEDEAIVMNLWPQTVFHFLAYSGYWHQPTKGLKTQINQLLQQIPSQQLQNHDEQKWVSGLSQQVKKIRQITEARTFNTSLLQQILTNKTIIKSTLILSSTLSKLQKGIGKTINLIDNRQLTKQLPDEINIYIFVCNENQIQIWKNSLFKNFPLKAFFSIEKLNKKLEYFLQNYLLKSEEPCFECMVIESKCFLELSKRDYFHNFCEKKNKYKISCVFMQDMSLDLGRISSRVDISYFFILVAFEKNQQIFREIERINKFLRGNCLIEMKLDISPQDAQLKRQNIPLSDLLFSKPIVYYKTSLPPHFISMIHLYLAQFVVRENLTPIKLCQQLLKCNPNIEERALFFNTSKIWIHFIMIMFMVKNRKACLFYGMSEWKKYLHDIDPEVVIKQISLLKNLNTYFSKNQSPENFCPELQNWNKVTNESAFYLVNQIIKHGFANWQQICTDSSWQINSLKNKPSQNSQTFQEYFMKQNSMSKDNLVQCFENCYLFISRKKMIEDL